MRAAESKQEVLQLQCSAAEVGKQKLTRALDSERTKVALQREKELLVNDLLEKDDALEEAQQAANRVEAEQIALVGARKAETKKVTGEQKVLLKQKLAVDKKLQSLKQRVINMDTQRSKLQDDLRTAIFVRPSPFLSFFFDVFKINFAFLFCFCLEEKSKAEAECRKAKLILKTTEIELERVVFQ